MNDTAPAGRSEATRESAQPNDELLADVEEAMRDVVDPELGINVVDLGLVYGLDVERGEQGTVALIDMTLTSAACPLTDVIASSTPLRTSPRASASWCAPPVSRSRSASRFEIWVDASESLSPTAPAWKVALARSMPTNATGREGQGFTGRRPASSGRSGAQLSALRRRTARR